MLTDSAVGAEKAQRRRWPLGASKGKEQFLSWTSSVNILTLAQETVCRLLTSRAVKEYICVVLGNYTDGDSLQQPQETKIENRKSGTVINGIRKARKENPISCLDSITLTDQPENRTE